MGWFIVRHENLYQVWSTVVDAPITGVCSLAGLKKFWKEELGRRGLEDLERDIAQEAAGNGRVFRTVEEAQVCNRAGKGGTSMTVEQIVDYYFVRRGLNDPPEGRDPCEE